MNFLDNDTFVVSLRSSGSHLALLDTDCEVDRTWSTTAADEVEVSFGNRPFIVGIKILHAIG